MLEMDGAVRNEPERLHRTMRMGVELSEVY